MMELEFNQKNSNLYKIKIKKKLKKWEIVPLVCQMAKEKGSQANQDWQRTTTGKCHKKR